MCVMGHHLTILLTHHTLRLRILLPIALLRHHLILHRLFLFFLPFGDGRVPLIVDFAHCFADAAVA